MYDSFERDIELPEGVDGDKISAEKKFYVEETENPPPLSPRI